MAGSAGSPHVLTVYACENGCGYVSAPKAEDEIHHANTCGGSLAPVEYVPREQSDALAFDAFIAGFEYTGPVHAPRIREAAKDWLNSYREATG